MKSLLITLLAIFFIHFASQADSWDNLTMEEAKSVVEELEKNPFIFNYCDCCDDESDDIHSALLIKVTATEIVTCEWNSDFYSVKYEGIPVAEVSILNGETSLADAGHRATEFTFYMNYTRGLHNSKASNFFNIIHYDYYGDNITCKKEFSYPNPKSVKAIRKVKGYKKWYKKNARG